MKKSFIGPLIILLTITFCNSCVNYDAERTREGIVFAIAEHEFNGIQGKVVEWTEPLRTIGYIPFSPESERYKIWFIYPATKFSLEPLHKIRLTYKITTYAKFPVIYVLKMEDLGPIKPKF